MKKSINLFLICMLAICASSFLSCSKSSKLEGYWYLTKWSKSDKVPNENEYAVAHFGSDGKCEFIVNDDGYGKGLSFDYKVSDNIITCTKGGNSDQLIIEELTDNNLIISGPNGEGTLKKITEKEYEEMFKGIEISYQ